MPCSSVGSSFPTTCQHTDRSILCSRGSAMPPSDRPITPDHTEAPLADLLSLAGRAAVVTGGGRGIGAATVRRLAEAGARVVAADLDTAAVNEVAASCPGTVLAAKVDVTDSASLAALA